jgi:hypothetical protein
MSLAVAEPRSKYTNKVVEYLRGAGVITTGETNMRLIFRSCILSSIFLCAMAASASNIARADLPFSFVIQGHSFPAGSYDIIMDPTHSFVTLANQTNSAEHIAFTLGPADEAAAPATLRFTVCDGRAFLRDIHIGVSITGQLNRRAKPANETCTDHASASTVTANSLDGTQKSTGR